MSYVGRRFTNLPRLGINSEFWRLVMDVRVDTSGSTTSSRSTILESYSSCWLASSSERWSCGRSCCGGCCCLEGKRCSQDPRRAAEKRPPLLLVAPSAPSGTGSRWCESPLAEGHDSLSQVGRCGSEVERLRPSAPLESLGPWGLSPSLCSLSRCQSFAAGLMAAWDGRARRVRRPMEDCCLVAEPAPF